MKNGFAGILFLIALAQAGFCKNFPVQHLTVENGLPSNMVYDVLRDNDNCLWFCTDKGVARFSGISFEKFTTKDGLPDNEVFSGRLDYEGRMWLNCYNGQLCYYKNGVFHNASNTPFLKLPFKPTYYVTVEVSGDSSVTLYSFDLKHIINVRHEKVVWFTMKDDSVCGFQTKDVAAITKISDDRYLAICWNNLTCIIDTNSNVVRVVNRDSASNYFMSFSAQGRYLYNETGLYSIDSTKTHVFNFTNDQLKTAKIFKVFTFDGHRFICTTLGLFVNNELTLDGNRISGMCQDAEGNYWVTSLSNGVFSFNADFDVLELCPNTYHSKIVYAGIAGKRLFFVTNSRNFYRLDANGPRLLFDYFQHFKRYYPTDESWRHTVNFHSDFGNIIDNDAYYGFNGNASFMVSGISGDSPHSRIFRDTSDFVTNIKEVFVRGGDFVLRNSFFLSFLNKQKLVKTGVHIDRKSVIEPGFRIFGTSFDDNGATWFSLYDEVEKVSGDSLIIQKQFGDITFKFMKIVHNYLVGISNKNQLVVCKNFDNNISTRVVEGADCIWDKFYMLNDSTFLLSTDRQYRLLHLLRGADSAKICIQIIENNSLPVQAEYICNNDSFCYFFKNGAVTKVPANHLFIKHLPPQITFNTLRTRNASYRILPGMEVKYGESKNISITFRPVSFGSRDLIYQYSISKDSTDYWRQVDNNEINLFDPGFGNYIVKVRARTLSGDFCAPYMFSFTILRPLWATWWFIALSAFFLGAAALLWVRLVVAQRIRKRELLHANEIRFLRSEYRALNALMNPHFIFNTLNNVQWLVTSGDNAAANQYLRVFSDLVRQNMHNISKELIPLSSEIELIKNYLTLEKLRFKNALNYEFCIDDDIDLDYVKIPPLLIQPLVENAIKHGLLPGTKARNMLTITVYKADDSLFVDIRDTGIGLYESQKNPRSLYKSTGIENIRNRIAKLSLAHDINISLLIEDVRNGSGGSDGTLARICIDLRE